jgi:Ferric iron reductase FhuF-like transporter/FhuF 2Fe-2S C-terminal domain
MADVRAHWGGARTSAIRGSHVLDDLAGLGPFFAVSAHPPGVAPVPPWRPVIELLTPSGALTARIASVRAALAAQAGLGADAIEPRVAASTLQLSLAARLVSPALGAAVLGSPVDLRSGGLWWQEVTGGPVPLSVPLSAGGNRERAIGAGNRGHDSGRDPDCGPGTAAGFWDHAGEWDQVLIEEVLGPVTEAIARLVPVSGRVLWGNVASAVNAAARQVARQRPDLAGDAWQAAARLFASPRLRGERNPPGPAFLRSSCCLFYRLAPGDPSATCGDCVLRGRAAR